MPLDMTVEGADKLARTAAALKRAGDRELSKQLGKAVTATVKPAKKRVKSSTVDFLPRRGGLAKRVSKTTLSHKTRKSGKSPRVTVLAKPGHKTLRDPYRVDRGRIKHPVFGQAHSRAAWVFQDVKPGWFSTPMRESAPEARKELVKAMDDLVRKIEGA